MFSVFFLENADLFINQCGARGEAPLIPPFRKSGEAGFPV